jgi:hypothetical protein
VCCGEGKGSRFDCGAILVLFLRFLGKQWLWKMKECCEEHGEFFDKDSEGVFEATSCAGCVQRERDKAERRVMVDGETDSESGVDSGKK